jgi:hypothetical protein
MNRLKTDKDYTPSPAESERWISPFVFLYKGKLWEVDRNMGVHQVKGEKHGRQQS